MRNGPTQVAYEKSGEKWMAGAKQIDPASVQALIDKLRDLTSIKFLDMAAGVGGNRCCRHLQSRQAQRKTAPRAAPSATIMLPVTPPAPLTNSVSPCATCSASSITCAAVRAGTGNAAAAPHDMLSGLCESRAAGATSLGAHAPWWRSGRRMGEDLVARSPAVGSLPDRHHDPGGLGPEGHRWRDADVPLALADDVVPGANAGGPDIDEDLVRGDDRRVGHVDQLDLAIHRFDPSYAHAEPTTGR